MGTCEVCGGEIWGKASLRRGVGDYCYRNHGRRRHHPTSDSGGLVAEEVGSRGLQSTAGTQSDLGLALVKSAVLGATCAGFPAACPTILMLSKADDAIQLSRRILQALDAREPPAERAETVGLVLSKAIVKSYAEAGANAALDPVIGRVAVLVAAEVSSAAPDTTQFAQRIVEGTVSGLAHGGIDGVLSYGLRDS
jgi:hypothetical protein